MTQTLPVALGSLAQSAANAAPGSPVGERLADVQKLLKDHLLWVEEALSAVSRAGPAPGSDAAHQLVGLGGKRVRPMALLLSAGCFGPIPERARHVAVCVELIHSATLLHDDVIDEGTERRGQPPARVVWGNAVSILGGDLLLTHALMTAQEHAPEFLQDLLATLRQLVEGEIVQLRGRSELNVSEDVYETILRDKTASLFRFSTRSGAILGKASLEQVEALGVFGDCLGMAFQLVDDLLDYSNEGSGKTLFADLKQGKLTLPLVLAVREQPTLLDTLKEIRAGDSSKVVELRERVIRSGVCSQVSERSESYTRRAIEQLRLVPDSPARSLLRLVAEQMALRRR